MLTSYNSGFALSLGNNRRDEQLRDLSFASFDDWLRWHDEQEEKDAHLRTRACRSYLSVGKMALVIDRQGRPLS